MHKKPRIVPTISPTDNPSFRMPSPVKDSGFMCNSSVKPINGKHITTGIKQPIKVVKVAFLNDFLIP